MHARPRPLPPAAVFLLVALLPAGSRADDGTDAREPPFTDHVLSPFVHEVRDLIHSLAATKTILLSTHILREVQVCCSRVVLINAGKIVFDGSVSEMEGSGHDMEGRFRELTKGRMT